MRHTYSAAKAWAGTTFILSLTLLSLLQSGARTMAADGIVLSMGLNSLGRTGLGTEIGITLVATPIETTNLAGKTITQVAASFENGLLLADDGTVFSFGWNNNGRTGLGIDVGSTLVATPIDTTNLAGKTITQIAAGSAHHLLLADDGTVFSFGSNGYGQTGLGTDSGSTLVATAIDASNLSGKKITQVAAGHVHSLLLADDGTVFSFGWNASGRTGLGIDSLGNTSVATPIDTTNLADATITQVAAGFGHSLLLADDGTVFSFGDNEDGRTGLGTDVGHTLVASPIDTTNLEDTTITQVAAGGEHSLLLADDGTVFSFGWNLFGATGLGTDIGSALVATPIDTSNLMGRPITQVAASSRHSLLLDDDGTAFSFGDNGFGRTGLGTDVGCTLVATPLDATNLTGTPIAQVSAGPYQSLLLAVPEPGGAMLVLLATVMLLVARRRR